MRQADPPDDKDDVAGVLLEYWPVDSVRVMARWQRHQDDDIYALDAVLQRWASETGVMDRVCAFILVEADEPTCHHRVLQRGRPDERYQRKDFNKLAAEYRRLYALRPASGLARRRGARVWRACRSIERSLPQAIAEPYSRAHRRGGIPLWIWSNPDGSAPSDVAGTSALLKCLRSSEPE
jgi:hypothetical protein